MTNFSGPLEDRLLIRELLGAYSDSVIQCNVEAWLANWTDDGIWKLFNKEVRGKVALRGQWERLWSTLSKMMFFTEIGSIEIDGERAKVRSYCREIMHFRDNSMHKVVGMYEDELVRANGEWFFGRRSYQLLAHEGRIQVCS